MSEVPLYGVWCFGVSVRGDRVDGLADWGVVFRGGVGIFMGRGFGVWGVEVWGSEAGSRLRLIDLVYHSTLGLRVKKKKKKKNVLGVRGASRRRVEGAARPLRVGAV